MRAQAKAGKRGRDMRAAQTDTTIEQVQAGADWDGAFADVLAAQLRCVSTGYLDDGRSCPAGIPREAVEAAWRAELQGGRGGGFFHLAWGGEVWLAYGVADGSVRGVYCPVHRMERERRAQTTILAPHETPGARVRGTSD